MKDDEILESVRIIMNKHGYQNRAMADEIIDAVTSHLASQGEPVAPADEDTAAFDLINAELTELSTLRAQVRALTAEREAAVKALKIFVDDALYLDLGGGDAVGTSCESLEAAKEALDLIATANPQT